MDVNDYIILLKANKTLACMSHNHITLEAEFFHAAPHPQLQELTASSDSHRGEVPLLDAPLLLPSSHSPPASSTSQTKFYQEYKRIHLIAFSLQNQKRRMQEELEAVFARLRNIETRLNHQEGRGKEKPTIESIRRHEQSSEDNRNKRSRRTAEEIQKKHQCHAHQCERYYGSQGSLQQHIKLKHPHLLRKSEAGEESEGSDENPSDFMPVD